MRQRTLLILWAAFITDFAALFKSSLNLGHGGIVWQAWLFAGQCFYNVGAKPLVVAGFLFYGLELGNDGGEHFVHEI